MPEKEVVLSLGHPKDYGCDVWQATLLHQPAPGVVLRATTVRDRPREESVYATFLKRKHLWVPRWQEAVEEKVLYRTWSDDAEWWNLDTPQAAWSACTSGEAMLWVLSRGYLTHPAWIFRELGLVLLRQLGVVEGFVVNALKYESYHLPEIRLRIVREWEKLDWRADTVEAARKRAPYCVAMAAYGYTPPFFELSYFAKEVVGRGGVAIDEHLARTVRSVLKDERWTTG